MDLGACLCLFGRVLITDVLFRSDYLLRGLTPHLVSIAKQGIRAEYMKPIFPVSCDGTFTQNEFCTCHLVDNENEQLYAVLRDFPHWQRSCRPVFRYVYFCP